MGKININYTDGNIGGVLGSNDAVSAVEFTLEADMLDAVQSYLDIDSDKYISTTSLSDAMDKLGICKQPSEYAVKFPSLFTSTNYTELTVTDATEDTTFDYYCPVDGNVYSFTADGTDFKDEFCAALKGVKLEEYTYNEMQGYATLGDVLSEYLTVTVSSNTIKLNIAYNLYYLINEDLFSATAMTSTMTMSDGCYLIAYGYIMYKMISDFYANCPNGQLYVNFKDTTAVSVPSDVRQLAKIGYTDLFTFASTANCNTINTAAEGDATNHKPYSVILGTVKGIAPNDTYTADVDYSTLGDKRVSVVNAIPAVGGYSYYCSPSGALEVLGKVANSNVANSIAWVEKNSCTSDKYLYQYNTELCKDVIYSATTLNNYFDNKNIIVPIKYVGNTSYYFNNDYVANSKVSDYNTVKRVRVMDKVARQCYSAMLPYISSPVYVDKSTGYLSKQTIVRFKKVLSAQLEQMENDMEVSGFEVTIEQNQNILQTATLNCGITVVPVGSADIININLAYALSI